MPNPFSQLSGKKTGEERGELVTGLFDCDEGGCYEKAREARYLKADEILTWKCPKGHISALKGFKL